MPMDTMPIDAKTTRIRQKVQRIRTFVGTTIDEIRVRQPKMNSWESLHKQDYERVNGSTSAPAVR